MNVTIQLDAEIEHKLRERAAAIGLTLESYLEQLAKREVTNGSTIQSKSQTFDEILAPIREGFAASGMSEEELTRMLDEAREEVWQEKLRGKSDG